MPALKTDIQFAIEQLGISAHQSIRVGDDAAAIPRDDGYDLLACEGMDAAFVSEMPWFAGWSAVMVNLSDIAAMGGTPTALVNAIWSSQDDVAGQVLNGMRDACQAFGVPMVGGHTNLHADSTQLSVSVLGHARHLLTSFDARPGQKLVMAVDLSGAWRGGYPFFDAATSTEPMRLRTNLSLLPEIARDGLATAAKDISQAGIIGTASMLAETSRVGMQIDFAHIPRPDNVDMERWMKVFPSFGFLLSTDEENEAELVHRFRSNDIAASCIGVIDRSRQVVVLGREDDDPVWDFQQQVMTGC
ncbi:MAG: sll0787 family AIR synthase-like protein [Planctomycetota bacterium]